MEKNRKKKKKKKGNVRAAMAELRRTPPCPPVSLLRVIERRNVVFSVSV
jgi:hypothetical protein